MIDEELTKISLKYAEADPEWGFILRTWFCPRCGQEQVVDTRTPVWQCEKCDLLASSWPG